MRHPHHNEVVITDPVPLGDDLRLVRDELTDLLVAIRAIELPRIHQRASR